MIDTYWNKNKGRGGGALTFLCDPKVKFRVYDHTNNTLLLKMTGFKPVIVPTICQLRFKRLRSHSVINVSIVATTDNGWDWLQHVNTSLVKT